MVSEMVSEIVSEIVSEMGSSEKQSETSSEEYKMRHRARLTVSNSKGCSKCQREREIIRHVVVNVVEIDLWMAGGIEALLGAAVGDRASHDASLVETVWLTLSVWSFALRSHTIAYYTHTHSLSLVLVAVMKPKELKTSRFLMLIL